MKTKVMSRGHDEYYTPAYALNPILDYLNRTLTIWEPFYGTGKLVFHLENLGFKVLGYPDEDFFISYHDCDIILSNPPFSIKNEVLERLFTLDKPFAMLLPITTLEGIWRGKLFAENDIQVIIPNRRIQFSNNSNGSWFASAWFTYKLNLPKDLIFTNLEIPKGE